MELREQRATRWLGSDRYYVRCKISLEQSPETATLSCPSYYIPTVKINMSERQERAGCTECTVSVGCSEYTTVWAVFGTGFTDKTLCLTCTVAVQAGLTANSMRRHHVGSTQTKLFKHQKSLILKTKERNALTTTEYCYIYVVQQDTQCGLNE